MHLGVLATSWPHESDRVAGSFVYALTRAIVARGHRATVLFAAHPRSRPLESDRCELVSIEYSRSECGLFYDHGAPHKLRAAPLASSALALSFSLRMLAAARGRLAACDALVSHFALPSALVAGLVRDRRPHHAIVHGTDALLLARAPAVVQRAIAKRATSLQFAHPGLRATLDPALAEHRSASDFPMAAAAPAEPQRASARRAVREALRITDDVVLIVCVARIASEKGADTLVRAARSLNPARALVVFVGDGPDRARLERVAPASVRFVGAVDADERDRWLAAADVFALTSTADSAPTAIVEALAFALPIVTTRVGGIPWLVEDAAMLVPPGDARAVGDALRSLVDSPTLRSALSRRAAARSRSLPSWDGLADHILQSVGATQ